MQDIGSARYARVEWPDARTVNGGQAGQLLTTLDGVASQDSGAPGIGAYLAPSVDAIGEVKLLVSNYTAEYGARNGGQMTITTKNGTPQFPRIGLLLLAS